jgi:hypothetical protein
MKESYSIEQIPEKLLQQIEESLTHSREIIDQIDVIRQLRLRVSAPNPPPLRV